MKTSGDVSVVAVASLAIACGSAGEHQPVQQQQGPAGVQEWATLSPLEAVRAIGGVAQWLEDGSLLSGGALLGARAKSNRRAR